MDAYPQDYVTHNLPLVLLSGLESESKDEPESVDYPLLREKGVKIDSDFPPVSGSTAEELRSVLLDEDASQVAWNAREDTNARLFGVGYKIKSIGRVGYLLFPLFKGSGKAPSWAGHDWHGRFTFKPKNRRRSLSGRRIHPIDIS